MATADYPEMSSSMPPRRGFSTKASIRKLFALHAIFLTVLVAYLARSLLIPIIFASFAGFLLHPALMWLRRHRLHPVLSALLVLVLLVALPGLALMQLVPAAAHWLDQLPVAMERAQVLLTELRAPLEQVNEATKQMGDMAKGSNMAIPVEVTDNDSPVGLAGAAWSGIVSIVLSLLLLFFILLYGETMLQRAQLLLPTASKRRRYRIALERMERDFTRYLITITLINLSLGAAVTIAMALCGMPDPFLWGAMAFALNYIPYVGAIVGTAMIALASLISTGPDGLLWFPPLLFYLLTVLEGYVITPMVIGHRFQMNPLVILLSVSAWGWLWGIAGALLAVPMLVAINILLASHNRWHNVTHIFGLPRVVDRSPIPHGTGVPAFPAPTASEAGS